MSMSRKFKKKILPCSENEKNFLLKGSWIDLFKSDLVGRDHGRPWQLRDSD